MRIRVFGGQPGAVSSPALPHPGSALGVGEGSGLSGDGQGFALFFRKFSFQDSSGCSQIAGGFGTGSRAWEVSPQLRPSPRAGPGFMEAAATYKIAWLINPLLPGSLMPEVPVMPGTDPTPTRALQGWRVQVWEGPPGASPLGFGELSWRVWRGKRRNRVAKGSMTRDSKGRRRNKEPGDPMRPLLAAWLGASQLLSLSCGFLPCKSGATALALSPGPPQDAERLLDANVLYSGRGSVAWWLGVQASEDLG